MNDKSNHKSRKQSACPTGASSIESAKYDSSAEWVTLCVERESPAMSGGTLREGYGIEVVGKTFVPLLQPGLDTPCSTTQVFATATNNQRSITLKLFRGNSDRLDRCQRLGEVEFTNLPQLAAGVLKLRIRLQAANGSLWLSMERNASLNECQMLYRP
jgi:hypothetical protein